MTRCLWSWRYGWFVDWVIWASIILSDTLSTVHWYLILWSDWGYWIIISKPARALMTRLSW
jgi:hypothetical protein